MTILLSTYNGARFLPECLESLRRQSHAHCLLDVRDDGSRDQTPQLLRQYATLLPSMRVTLGVNEGVVSSFFKLLADAREASYYAFCDQDDVWMTGKIARALSFLSRVDTETPALYCSATYLVDADLKVLGCSAAQRAGPGFGHALLQNIAQGCTMVINRSARALLCETQPDAERLIMFDWWVYLLIAGAGTVLFDDHPQVFYRQHALNTIGTSASRLRNQLRALHDLLQSNALARCVAQAHELRRRAAPHLTPVHRTELIRFLQSRSSLPSRLHYALTGRARRNTTLGTLVYRLASILP